MKKATFLKLISLCLCVILLMPAFSACKTADGGKTVYWLLSSSPKNLDPQTARGESELNIIKNCFSGLFEKDADGEMVSSVVEHYDVSKDGLKYTFYFYDDLYWSILDGRKIEKYAPLTAEDFVFAIHRVFTDNRDCSAMNVLRSIKNADKVLSGESADKLAVKAESDTTLSITLKEKNSALLEALTSPELFPCNRQFFDSTSGRYGLSADALIFNGSFCVTSWGESSIRLSANENSADKPAVSSVLLYQPKASRETVKLLKDGEIDAAILSFEQYDSIENIQNYTLKEYKSAIWALILNPEHELWKSESLRKAIIFDTDRSVIEQGKHSGATSYIVPDSALVFSENYRELAQGVALPSYNAKAAKALYLSALSELGVGEIYNTEILIADNSICKDNFGELSQIYQRDLPLYFSRTELSESALLSRVKSGDFAAAVVPLKISYDTVSCTLDYFSSDSLSCIFPISNGDFTSGLNAALRASSAKEAAAGYKKAEQALYDTSTVCPLFYENGYFVSSNSVEGIYIDSLGSVIFKNVTKK